MADGVQLFENALHQNFPGARLQKCAVHKMRNVLNKVRPSHKADVARDLKHVFDNFDANSFAEIAKIKLQKFICQCGRIYPYIANNMQNETIEYYFTYIDFPCNLRRMIYTTNLIENLNKKIRKATKNKQSFEKPQRLLDYLFIIIKDFEFDNWMKYPVSAFSNWTQLNTGV